MGRAAPATQRRQRPSPVSVGSTPTTKTIGTLERRRWSALLEAAIRDLDRTPAQHLLLDAGTSGRMPRKSRQRINLVPSPTCSGDYARCPRAGVFLWASLRRDGAPTRRPDHRRCRISVEDFGICSRELGHRDDSRGIPPEWDTWRLPRALGPRCLVHCLARRPNPGWRSEQSLTRR
jgi:hypothetical protein